MEKCPPGVICLSNSLVIGFFLICIISGILFTNQNNSFKKTKQIIDSSEENETISDIIKQKHTKPSNPIIVVNSQQPPPSPPDPQFHVHNNMSTTRLTLPLRSMPNTTSVLGVPINIQTRGANS